MKKIFILLSIVSVTAFSQTGVDTNNPQGTLHVDGAGDNATTGIPTTAEAANDFVVTDTGDVGVGTITPHTKLEVNGIISSTPITLNTDNSNITSTVTSVNPQTNDGDFFLPNPEDVPGAIIFVRNINTNNTAEIKTNSGTIINASNVSGANNFYMVGLDNNSTKSKTVIFISDGSNWTAFKASN